MKQLLFIMTFWLGIGLTAMAQDGEDTRDGGKVEALKIAYLTKKMNLSTEEAQKFWPIYNQYMDDIRKVRSEARQNKDKEIDTEEKMLNIRKKYNSEFVKALSTEKVNTFFKAEKEFGTVLQRELMERRLQRQNNGGRLRQP